MGNGYGSIFVIEICTTENPRWRRWSLTHYPTATQAEERVANLWKKGNNRTFRVAEYRRDPAAPEEYTP